MKEINSLEISFLVKKIKEDSVSSKIQKIKQISQNTFLFELYKQKKRQYLVLSDRTLFLTDKSYEHRLVSNLYQVIKKHILGQIIEDVRQHEFDRIVEIETRDYLIIIELFGNGNIILVNKPDRKVITALIKRSWRDRSILSKREYQYPPYRVNPFKLNQSELEKLFGEKEVVRVLAVDLGFGGEIARKICRKIGVDTGSNKINVSKIYKFLKNINREFEELKDINEQLKNEFKKDLTKIKELIRVDEKYDRIKKAQEEALKKWQEKEILYRKIGKLMYERYEEVKKQLDSGKNKIVVDELTIEVNPRKSVQKNAEVYFEKAKKVKKKIEGLKKAMTELRKKKPVVIKKEPEKEVKREWYDNFRWIKSSDGFLIVGGKDAKTNEQLIRKYMKNDKGSC